MSAFGTPSSTSTVDHESDMPSQRTHARANGGYLNSGPLTKRRPSYTVADMAPTKPDGRHEVLLPNRAHQSKTQHITDTATNLDPSASSRKRSEPVRSACGQCQKRKTKCSGHRPTCNFCGDRGLECSWDISDGLTRNADLKEKLTKADGHLVDISTIVNDMRTNTDEIATTLLAKLRLGDSIEDLAAGIRAGTSLTENLPGTHRRDSYLQSLESTRNHHKFVGDEALPSDISPYAFNWPAPP